MEIRVVGLYIICIFFSNVLVSQINIPSKYCENIIGNKISNFKNEFIKDSLYVSFEEKNNSIELHIVNTTKDTLYLFNSYFSEMFYSSKYLHRIKKKKKEYIISFLPLVPYLSTISTDKQIINANRIIQKGQVLYNFVKLIPQTYFTIEIPYNSLFKNINNKKNVVCASVFQEKLNKFDKVKFKYFSSRKLKGIFELLFEFAIYDKVNLLCESSSYYLDETNFNTQANSYTILRIPITLKNYKHSLFGNGLD